MYKKLFTVYHEDIRTCDVPTVHTQAVEMITLTCHYKVIPADSTIVRLHKLFAKLSNWEVMLGSHCSMCNADGAVYQTHQELITANEFIAMQLEIYVFREDRIPRKLHISVDDVTSSAIIYVYNGNVTKCTTLLVIMVPVHS